MIASQIRRVTGAAAGATDVMTANWLTDYEKNWTFLMGQLGVIVQAQMDPPMYVPPAFREDDLAALQETMRGARLTNFITATGECSVATPLPLFLTSEEGPYGTLYGHPARANPQWKLPPTGDAIARHGRPGGLRPRAAAGDRRPADADHAYRGQAAPQLRRTFCRSRTQR